jgi:hypothetical protein
MPRRGNEDNALAASGPETPLPLIEPIARIVAYLDPTLQLLLDDLFRSVAFCFPLLILTIPWNG